jgi:tetratricopeptide (TPR) repeat protein
MKIMFVSAMPKGSPYLQEASDEINEIDTGIFHGYDVSNSNEFITKQYQHITRENFTFILKFKPDILHFTGHGEETGIVFDDGTPISPQQLESMFADQNIKLLFLNSCHSSTQIEVLRKLPNIKSIIGIKKEISELEAKSFATLFYAQFMIERDVPKAFLNAMTTYQFNWGDKKEFLPIFYPEEEYKKYEQSKEYLSPIGETILELKIKLIQNRKIPNNLMNKILKTIRIYDENVVVLNDPIKFTEELENISLILFSLLAYAIEYGINPKQRKIQRTKNMEIIELIRELKNNDLSHFEKIKIIKDKSKIYHDIIMSYKKIYFEIKVDSIQNVEPLLPEYPSFEFFTEIVDIMYSLLKSLNLLREKVVQFFIPVDEIYNHYLVNNFYNFIYHLEIDYTDLIQLLKQEMDLKIDEINLNDDLKIDDYISDLRNELQEVQPQIDNGSRIINLKQCLEIIFIIEEKLTILFRIIIRKKLEMKNKNPFTENSPKISKLPKQLSKEINILEKKLTEDENLDTPQQKLFTILNKLINKITEGLKIYYKNGNDNLNYNDISSFYKNIKNPLVLVKNSIKDYSRDYPYLFPEIAELCDFYEFRLNRLEKKQDRDKIIKINFYLDEGMYEKVKQFSNIEDEDNIRILNKIGVANLYLEEYATAKENFEKILKRDKFNINALFNLGLTHQQIESKESPQKFIESIKCFEEVIRREPNHFESLTSLGLLYYKIQDYNSADKYIKEALKVSGKDDWRALLIRGCILSEGFQNYKDAKDYFDECEDLNPNSLIIKLNKSQNLILLKSYEEAEELLRKVIEKTDNIENRSSKIITRILLICSNYLYKNGNGNNTSVQKQIEELLRLYNLKDSNLVDWNFESLKKHIAEHIDNHTHEDKDFLGKILSIPGPKSNKTKISLIQDIQSFLNKLQSSKIKYIDEYYDKIKINVVVEKKIQISAKNDLEWYVWNISIEQPSSVSNDIAIESVSYKFDPSFQDKEATIDAREDNKFLMRAIGWDESKVEVELNLKDGSRLKKVIVLKK